MANRSPAIKRVLQAALGVGLIVILLWRIGIQNLFQEVSNSEWRWLLAALCIMLSAYFLRGISLLLLLGPEVRIGIVKLFRLNLISAFFSTLVPLQIGGDIIKGLYLREYFDATEKAYGALLLHRGIGAAGTLLVSVSALLVFWFSGRTSIIITVGLLVASCASFYILARLPLTSFQALLSYVGEHKRPFIRWPGILIQHSINYRKKPTRMALCMLLSVVDTGLGIFTYYLIGHSIGHPIALVTVYLAGSLSQLSTLLALTPAGIGIAEGAFVGACHAVGVSQLNAFSIAILMRALMTIAALLGGVFYLFWPLRSSSRAESLAAVDGEHH